jgi:hypothetical protein
MNTTISDETARMRRGLEVYDTVINVLKTYEGEDYHDVDHGRVPLEDFNRVVVTLSCFDDGVAETLIKKHDFKLGEDGNDVVVYRDIY